MFGLQTAEVVRHDLIAMREQGILSITELMANQDIIGKDLFKDATEDQQTRAKALRDVHLDALQALQNSANPAPTPGESSFTNSVSPQEGSRNKPLSTDKADVDIRRRLAAYLVRIKDRLSADEFSAVNMPYIEAHGDFKTEADHKIGREIAAKYNVPDKHNAALHKMIKDRVGADINAVAELDVQEALAKINLTNSVEFGLLFEDIVEKDTETDKKGIKGVAKSNLKKAVDGLTNKLRAQANTRKTLETDKGIIKAAKNIAERGDPLKFMLDTFNKSHKGDRDHAEAQLIEFAQQCASNAIGRFGTWEGGSGKGKSNAAKGCVRQLPPEYVITSSITAKSLYYRSVTIGILPGSVLFLDDRRVPAGSDLEDTIKGIQTFFQEGAEHETVVNGEYLHTKLAPRMIVVRTYVDSQETDRQLKNRTGAFDVDSSEATDKEVCELKLELAESGATTEDLTRQGRVVRELWRDIKGCLYKVILPAASKIVTFSNMHDRRNTDVFLGYVIGLACIRHRQRRVEEVNGEKLLYASIDDYIEAARIFNSQSAYLGSKLDKNEYEAVRFIEEHGTKGARLSEIHTQLAATFPNDGWNLQKVRRMMDGRPERNLQGLVDNVPGMTAKVYFDGEIGRNSKIYTVPKGATGGCAVSIKLDAVDILSHLFPRISQDGKYTKQQQQQQQHNNNIPSIPNIPLKRDEGIKVESEQSITDVHDELSKNLENISFFSPGENGKIGREKCQKYATALRFLPWETVGNVGNAPSNVSDSVGKSEALAPSPKSALNTLIQGRRKSDAPA
jgi:hypothetical protein